MNTNHINNKNLKRIAIAAGTTAAALFLSAGLVACDGKSGDTVAAPAQAAQLADALQNVVADIVPSIDEAAILETAVAPAEESTPKSVAKPAVKSTKSSKKKAASTGGSVILDAPAAGESTPVVDTTVAPAPRHADSTVVTTPADQPAVAEAAAPADQPAATATPSNTGSNTSTWPTFPKITGTPSITSTLSSTDLTKLISPITVPKPCLPGISC